MAVVAIVTGHRVSIVTDALLGLEVTAGPSGGWRSRESPPRQPVNLPTMQRLAPCLMLVGDQCGKAEEAMELYVSAFEGSRVIAVERFGPEDEGERGIKHARFQVAGREVVVMDSARPHQLPSR